MLISWNSSHFTARSENSILIFFANHLALRRQREMALLAMTFCRSSKKERTPTSRAIARAIFSPRAPCISAGKNISHHNAMLSSPQTHNQLLRHTRDIFHHLYREVSCYVPQETLQDMAVASEAAELDDSLSVEELETMVVSFGKKVWPYRKAFDEFMDIEEGRLGEKFFLQKLSPEARRAYRSFLEEGHTFRDLKRGKHVTSHFSPEERTICCAAFVDMRQGLREYVLQEIRGLQREHFEERVEEFLIILKHIEERLDALRDMADLEQEHPHLAAEIRTQIRAFEHGLCLLATNTSYAAVCRAGEHFEGRRVDLGRYVFLASE